MKDMMLLIVITYVYIGAKADCTAIRCKQPVYDFQDGSFAGSIVTDNRYVFSPFQRKADIFKQTQGIKRFG